MSDSEHSHSGFFVLRTPLLPLDELERVRQDLEAPRVRDDAERLEQAIARDRYRLRAGLQSILTQPTVQEALFLASADLYSALEPWESNPDSAGGRKVEHRLVRYVARMTGRATPFGLLAGHTLAAIGDDTRLALEPVERNQRNSCLDRDYLDALVATLVCDPEVRKRLNYRPNASLHRMAGQLRYVETHLDGFVRSHHLTEVDATEHLEAALKRAAYGATPSEVAAALVSSDVTSEEAQAYVRELIEGQVLIPELELPVTGEEPLAFLLHELRSLPAAARYSRRLSHVRDALAELDGDGLGCDPGRYRQIARTLEELPARVELNRLVHVDMVKPAPDAMLDQQIVEDLVRGVGLLQRLAPPDSSPLDGFRDRFWSRYNRREVPLLEAVDEEVGVGFPESGLGTDDSPLLAGLGFPKTDDASVEWGKREGLLLAKLMETVAVGERSLTLANDELSKLEAKEPRPLPDALFVLAKLARQYGEGAGGGYRLLLDGAVGPSGGRLLGRFLHGDIGLRRRLEEHLRAEEALQPDALFAEIAHLPGASMGNILCRPLLRAHEIPYLGRSGAPPPWQIHVADLCVSVWPTRWDLAGEIVLRSRRLNKRVIPRLTTAHNFHSFGAPLYRFLCLLQEQNVASNLGWSWGPLAAAPFLPRVEVGNLVLSLARWRISQQELRSLAGDGSAARLRAVWRVRDERGLPRRVALVDGDNVLPLDLDDVLSVESFLALVKDRDEVELMEMWPEPGELVASGPEGNFVHELIVPLVRRAAIHSGRAGHSSRSRSVDSEVARTFVPGSEWVSAKLYLGSIASERILTHEVAPLVEDLIGSGIADRWFFIRFADPEHHLRLRFHGGPLDRRQELLQVVQQRLGALVDHDHARSLVLDSYEREIERYGGPHAIETAERIFHADSDAVIDLLSMLESGVRGREERWQMAVAGASMLLSDLSRDEKMSIGLLENQRAFFAREFRVDAAFGRRLGQRLRELRSEIEPLIDIDADVPDALRPGIDVLRTRSRRLRPLISQLDTLAQQGTMAVSRAELTASYIHMYMNRLLRSAQWAHEFVIYDFLLHLHRSRAARGAVRHGAADGFR